MSPFSTQPLVDPIAPNGPGAAGRSDAEQQVRTWDAMESYFECITTCSLDDGECVTQCVDRLREHS